MEQQSLSIEDKDRDDVMERLLELGGDKNISPSTI